jgi:hypothetical protein
VILRMVGGFRRSLLVAAVLAALVMVSAADASAQPNRAGYTSFFSYVSSALYFSYSGVISVSGYSRFSDSDCYPSYACDHNVDVTYELRRGFGRYGLLLGRTYASTGQYGSFTYARFRVPTCQQLIKGTMTTLTVVMDAVAPDGEEKVDYRTVYLRSCRF